ncbi:MAG: DsbA family protein [Rubricoccaceae bacterium]
MTIDVFADIACPWCYIGEARLQQALNARPGLAAARHWRPFQLQPDLPPEGRPVDPFFYDKFGGRAQTRAMFAHVTRVGAADGVRFDFGRLAGAPNTADAHRLILWAAELDRAWPMAHALFAGYFAEGRDLGRVADLRVIAEAAGLDGDRAVALLASDRYRTDVAQSQHVARRAGITGVPFYVFDGRYAVSGAQAPEVFGRVLDRVAAERAQEQTPEAGT